MSELNLGAPFLARSVREKWGFSLTQPHCPQLHTQPMSQKIGEDDRMVSMSAMRILQQSSVVGA
jgi:hypothetical protein